MKRTYTESVYL